MNYIKITLILGTFVLLTGCTPKIIAMKSSMTNLEAEKCFNLPSREELVNGPIYKQKLYELTKISLDKYNINSNYGKKESCSNYLLTDWIVSRNSDLVTKEGTTTYINNHRSLFRSPYGNSHRRSYRGTGHIHTTPDITYVDVSYDGVYSLEVGTIKNNKNLVAWNANQSGETSATSLADAQNIPDKAQEYIDEMVKQMLLENNLFTSK